jgi:hypothetical protein
MHLSMEVKWENEQEYSLTNSWQNHHGFDFFCFAYNRLFLSTSLEGKETTEKKSQKRKREKI